MRLENIYETYKSLQQNKPLILCLTNNVTMDFMANSLLALGAAPLMSEDVREIEELVTLSHAINLNIGTLDPQFITRALLACNQAKEQNKNIILDPVGAGASQIRTLAAKSLTTQVTSIRGNASEIRALCDPAENKSLGVESLHEVEEAAHAAMSIATQHDCVVIVSGAADLVVQRAQQKRLPFGTPLMSRITGMGCTLTAVIAAFQSVCEDAFSGALQATAFFGLCGQQAEKISISPGSFRMHFIDALHNPDWEQMNEWWSATHA